MTFLWPELEPPTAAAQDSLRRLSASVAVARGLVATGRPIDLGGLDSLTGRLCAQVMDLSHTDGSAIRPGLAALHRDVAGLIDALKATAQ